MMPRAPLRWLSDEDLVWLCERVLRRERVKRIAEGVNPEPQVTAPGERVKRLRVYDYLGQVCARGFFRLRPPLHTGFAERIATLYDIPDPGRITVVSARGASRPRGANVVSCNIAENLVRRAGAVALSRGVVGDACNLCFKGGAFEILISREMIEHTSRPLGAIRELVRVLRPGGIVVITTPNRVWQGVVRLASHLHFRPVHGLENFVRRSELRDACTAPDLDVLEHIGFHVWPFQFGFSGLSRRVDRRFGAGPLASLMINQAVLARKARRNQALTTGPRASRVC